VIASARVVLNPAYCALGLYASGYHTLSYIKRCGNSAAVAIDAEQVGRVDYVLPGSGTELCDRERDHAETLLSSADNFPSFWEVGVHISMAM
jgi:hypothetical protein